MHYFASSPILQTPQKSLHCTDSWYLYDNITNSKSYLEEQHQIHLIGVFGVIFDGVLNGAFGLAVWSNLMVA